MKLKRNLDKQCRNENRYATNSVTVIYNVYSLLCNVRMMKVFVANLLKRVRQIYSKKE